MKWTIDDAGDLVNLSYAQVIIISPITEEDSRPDEDSTHEVLAIMTDETSFRLGYGTETVCKHIRESIREQLKADLILPPEVVR